MIIIRVAHLRAVTTSSTIIAGSASGPASPTESSPTSSKVPTQVGAIERSMLLAVDQLVTTHDIDDATWSALVRHLDEPRLISFTLLVGQYDSLATTIGTLRIQRILAVVVTGNPG